MLNLTWGERAFQAKSAAILHFHRFKFLRFMALEVSAGRTAVGGRDSPSPRGQSLSGADEQPAGIFGDATEK